MFVCLFVLHDTHLINKATLLTPCLRTNKEKEKPLEHNHADMQWGTKLVLTQNYQDIQLIYCINSRDLHVSRFHYLQRLEMDT